MPDVPVCRLCATWECTICNHRYYYQNQRFAGTRKCKQCGSPRGSFIEVRHSSESLMQDHVDIHRFAETTDHKFDHYRSFDQYATFLARQEIEEAMPESPARGQTAKDFEKAEWAKHPAGLFAHRAEFNTDFPWVVVDGELNNYLHSDEGMADRGDFEIVETSTVITRRKLNQIIDNHETDTVTDLEEVIVEAGVKIVEDEPLPIPQDLGVRFVAKKGDEPVEWEFVTVRVPTADGEGIGILCTDLKDYTGLCLPPAEFTERGFHVMELP